MDTNKRRVFAALNDERLLTRIARGIREVSFLVARYPCYTPSSIEKRTSFSQPDDDDDEDENEDDRVQYEQLSSQRMFVFHLVWTVANFVFWVTVVHTALEAFKLINQSYPETNLTPLNPASSNKTRPYMWLLGGDQLASSVNKFGCLRTNCPHVLTSNTPLHAILLKLPLYKLCKPFKQIVTPEYINLGYIGIVIVIFTFGQPCCLLGLYFMQLFKPNEHLTFMYMIAPKLAISSLHNRIESMLIDVSLSYFNYRAYYVTETNSSIKYPDQPHSTRLINVGSRKIRAKYETLATSGGVVARNRDMKRELGRIMAMTYANGQCKSSSKWSSYIKDCIPLVRTQWWRMRLLKALVVGFGYFAISVTANFYGWMVFGHFGMVSGNKLLAETFRQIQTSNCSVVVRPDECRAATSVWLANGLCSIQQTFGFDLGLNNRFCDAQTHRWLNHDYYLMQASDLPLDWTNWHRVVLFVTYTPMNVAWVVFGIHYVMGTSELHMWITQIELQLELAIELAAIHADMYAMSASSSFSAKLERMRVMLRANNDHDEHEEPTSNRSARGAAVVSLEPQADIHRQRVTLSSWNEAIQFANDGFFEFSPRRRPCVRNGRYCGIVEHERMDWRILIENEAIVFYLDNETNIDDVLFEYLEKIYINLRLLIHHWPDYSNAAIAMVYSILVGYSASFYISYDLRSWAIGGFTIFSFCTLSLPLITALNIYTRGRKINALIWSLLAHTSQLEDLRYKHLNSLWLRTVRYLDCIDGLTFEGFGYRITHLNVGQFVLYSISLVVIICQYGTSLTYVHGDD